MLVPNILVPPQFATLKVQTPHSNVRCVDSCIYRTMASGELEDQLWYQTSVPTMFYYKGTKCWHLRLQHTRTKKRHVKEGEGPIESKEHIERMCKVSKAHRNIIDMDPGYIETQ